MSDVTIGVPAAAARFGALANHAPTPEQERDMLRLELQKQEHTTATLAKALVALVIREDAHEAVIPRDVALRAEGAAVQVEETRLGNVRVRVVERAPGPIIVTR